MLASGNKLKAAVEEYVTELRRIRASGSGTGELFFNSFGSIVEKEIDGSFVVDTSHVVAWEPGLSYSIRGMGGIKSTLLSGEGLVMEFSGSGKLYLQTRTLPGLASWLTPFAT